MEPSEAIDKIYKAVKKNSNLIIHQGNEWTKELAGSKNFICTPDFKHWTFGKSVGADGEYHYNGGIAKQHLYNLGFINVFTLKNSKMKEDIIHTFKVWIKKVKSYPIAEKFERDQKANKRFELLVHKSNLNNDGLITSIRNKKRIQQKFDEGFKTQIILEVAFRDRKLIALAKEIYGTKCCVCSFDFGITYGTYGDGFVEMHHLFPIAKGKRKTTIADLRPVCANCHRMLHHGDKLMRIEDLKKMLN